MFAGKVAQGAANMTQQLRNRRCDLLISDGEKEILLSVERIDWVETAEFFGIWARRKGSMPMAGEPA